jgi:hypothetical protein
MRHAQPLDWPVSRVLINPTSYGAVHGQRLAALLLGYVVRQAADDHAEHA